MLSDQEALEGGNAQKEAITALGLQYSLLTQYTELHRRRPRRAQSEPDAVDDGRSSRRRCRTASANLAIGAEVPSTPEAEAGWPWRSRWRSSRSRSRPCVVAAAEGRDDGIALCRRRPHLGACLGFGAAAAARSGRLPRVEGRDRRAACAWRRSLPSLLCVAAFALAPLATLALGGGRLGDGSDDPLGLAALAVLAVAIARLAPRLRAEPVPGWLAVAVLLTSLATVAGLVAPPLLAAVLAALAFAAALAAFVPAGTPVLPLAGLATLALPVVSSLQFYAGYPLRLVTAEASRWLLGLAGFDASREGSAMLVDGRLVIVDAPCSGVQMVWMAWFCACAVACWRGLPDRAFAKRLAFVGAIVLAGNIVRNALLVGLEARGTASPWQHEAIGMVVLGIVCAAVAALVASAPRPAPRRAIVFRPQSVALQGPLLAALALLLTVCALTPLAWPRDASATAPATSPTEWPREWNGRALRPLALGGVEARFAAQLPRPDRASDR